jgi:anti-sigma factor RsiW
MITHLSSEQVAEYIVGYPSPIVAEHLRDCPACRAEVVNFREALGDFRWAVHSWSEEQASQYQASAAPATPAVVPARWWTPSHQFAGALLVAAICVIASFVMPRHPEKVLSSDAVLLSQVDAQVSRTVPSSMEPLMKLVVQK